MHIDQILFWLFLVVMMVLGDWPETVVLLVMLYIGVIRIGDN